MKATLLPLEGKYYGTRVEVKYGEGKYDCREINFWISDLGKSRPSTRELGDITTEQWDNNSVLTSPSGETYTAEEALGIFDTHWESQMALDLAQLFVKAVNELKG